MNHGTKSSFSEKSNLLINPDNKKSFSLIELIIVIIIVGILATLGLTQYSYIIEKGRIAEVVRYHSQIRKLAQEYYLKNGTITTITKDDLNIGTGSDQIPYSCRSSNYYYVRIARQTENDLGIDGARCTANGKNPNWQGDTYIIVYEWRPGTGVNGIWCYNSSTCTFCKNSGFPTSSPQ